MTRKPRSARLVLTPEGVPITVRLADRGERLAAVLIDLLYLGIAIAVVALIALGLPWYLDLGEQVMGWALSATVVLAFLVRSFYFAFFELRWQGSTPGKRAMGLRVMDRGGGPLTAEAVFARNLMREVELFLPLNLLLSGGDVGIDAAVRYAVLTWLLLFTFLPLMNRDRLRAGDLLAGTWVVTIPRPLLLDDLVSARKASEWGFSEAQLDIYGVYELQALEQVLRMTGAAAAPTREAVTEKIRERIAWTGEVPQGDAATRRFLKSFYAAMRTRQETGLLMGRRRERQRHPGSVPRSP